MNNNTDEIPSFVNAEQLRQICRTTSKAVYTIPDVCLLGKTNT